MSASRVARRLIPARSRVGHGMFYKLLGMRRLERGEVVLRRKYGSTYAPKPLLAGGVIAVVAAVAIVAARGQGD